jgi:hypothetical protein
MQCCLVHVAHIHTPAAAAAGNCGSRSCLCASLAAFPLQPVCHLTRMPLVLCLLVLQPGCKVQCKQ